MKKFYFLALALSLFFVFFQKTEAQFPTTDTTRRATERMFQNDMKGAMEILDKAIAKKKDLVEALKMRAQLRMQSGDFEGSITDLTAAIEASPNDANLFLERGFTRFTQRKNVAEAVKDFDSAIALGLKNERVFNLRAESKKILGDTEGAIKDFQAVIALYPDSAQSHAGLSLLLFDKGETEAALANLRGFLERYEQNRDGKLPKVRGEQSSPGKVIDLGLENEKDKQLVVGGDQIRIKGDTPEELQKNLKAFEDKKYIAYAYGHLGLIYFKQNNFDEALAAFDKALKIDPSETNAIIFRGKTFLQKGSYEQAIDDFDKSLKRMPMNYEAYANRGIAYLMLGKDEAAQKDFDKYLQFVPNGKDTLDARIAEAKEKRAQNPAANQK